MAHQSKLFRLLSNLLKQNIMVRTIECLSALPKVNKIVIFEPDVANSTDLQGSPFSPFYINNSQSLINMLQV